MENNTYQNLSKIKDLCESKIFLQTISLNSTSVIPHQLHLLELKIILENIKKRFNKDFEDKIIKLFKFRIPYYIGPLNDKSIYSNVVRKNNSTVTPWNFEEVVDVEKSREKFMSIRTNSCQKLLGEDVLPKSSLVYQKYDVLDKINCIKINGMPIDVSTKKMIIENLFKKPKKITKKSK